MFASVFVFPAAVSCDGRVEISHLDGLPSGAPDVPIVLVLLLCWPSSVNLIPRGYTPACVLLHGTMKNGSSRKDACSSCLSLSCTARNNVAMTDHRRSPCLPATMPSLHVPCPAQIRRSPSRRNPPIPQHCHPKAIQTRCISHWWSGPSSIRRLVAGPRKRRPSRRCR